MKSAPVVFIHGMFMNGSCWEGWMKRYSARGLTCSAPSWPGRDATVAELRARHPDPVLGTLDLRALVDHFSKLLGDMKDKPVLVGHSMGGLLVQLLLQRNLAIAGVVIDSAPPQGVLTAKLSFFKANFPAVNPFKPIGQPVMMTEPQFAYAFVTTLAPDEQHRVYERYAVPESRRIPRQSLTKVGKVDFGRPHPPLLLIAGEKDTIVPAVLNRKNFKRYRDTGSSTDFKEFPGRAHFIIGQPGWEEVADFAAEWIGRHAAL